MLLQFTDNCPFCLDLLHFYSLQNKMCIGWYYTGNTSCTVLSVLHCLYSSTLYSVLCLGFYVAPWFWRNIVLFHCVLHQLYVIEMPIKSSGMQSVFMPKVLRSGLCAIEGHSGFSTPILAYRVFMDLALYTGVLSCWNMSEPDSSSEEKL